MLSNLKPINFLALPLICLASFAYTQNSVPEKFELVKGDSPVFIYERWITFPGKVPAVRAREVKSEFTIYTTIPKLLSILKDEAQIKTWQAHVAEFKVFPADTIHWFEYSYHDIPWPVSDQDHFLKYQLIEKVPGEKIFISFQSFSDPKLAPIKSGVSRMELVGSWLFEQVTPTQVKVTYRILSMPSSIPRMFTDPVVRSNLLTTIKALTKLAEEKN
jgi:hypothetical protein